MSNSQIPFLPFTKPTIDEATIAAVGEVLRSGWITTGPKNAQLEKTLSDYFGGRPVRCFANGTATMEIALRIAGIGPGDEVITSPISWVSTSNVILTVGAKPVFVDIDPVTRNIDLNLIEQAITPATKAIMPVYLAGLPVDMERLYRIADKYHLRVIEDAAQALGSSWLGNRIGAASPLRSDLVSFSLVLEHIENLDIVFQKVNHVIRDKGYIYIGELHPFKQYTGTKARFETAEGLQIVTCFIHHISDFIYSAKQYGFQLIEIKEYFDEDDKTGIPRILTLLLQKL